MNVLGINWDFYIRRHLYKANGDYILRQQECAEHLDALVRIVYSPRGEKQRHEIVDKKIKMYYSNSYHKVFFPFDALRIAGSIIKETPIDIISAEDPVFAGLIAWMASKRYKIPFNVQMHCDEIDNPARLAERKIDYLYNAIAKWVVTRADSIRVSSEDTKEKLLRLGIDKRKVWVIPVRVNASQFESADGTQIRSRFLADKHQRIVLFAGRLSPEKDIPTLLKALRAVTVHYPWVVLLIAGKGAEKDKLVNMTEALGIEQNVVFLGAIDYDVLPQYYAACDVFVLPSLREGRAAVLIEAILTKAPVIATDVSGVKECVINNETGFVINPGDNAQLAENLLFLLTQPDKAVQFGEAGYTLFKDKLEASNNMGALVQCWQETATKRHSDTRIPAAGHRH